MECERDDGTTAMITFTQLKTRTADIIGVITAPSQTMTNIAQDINQAQRMIEASARRYFTRLEKVANIVAGQQYYTLPADCVRLTTVRSNTGGLNWPVVQVDSEELWNRFNVIPSNTVIVPQFVFVRGNNEFGFYPTPSTSVSGGAIISYEARAQDMAIEDTTTTTVTVTNGSQFVTSPSVSFNTNMNNMIFSTSDGSDGNWYRIVAATSSQLTLENYYQGPTESGVACIIGQAPVIPEAYQLGLVYYAAYNFYLKRNENANAIQYKGLFEDVLQQYKAAYADKTTGVVQKPLTDNIFNIFWLPPGIIS